MEFSDARKPFVEALEAMSEMVRLAESNAVNVAQLSERARMIDHIVASVRTLADQTNLLAVNAAIEASRAGEHGKGFSVVAGEVKELASQSKQATPRVRKLLEEIDRSTRSAVLDAETNKNQAERASAAAKKAGARIERLVEAIDSSSRLVGEIAEMAKQQNTGMADVRNAMDEFSRITKHSLAAVENTKQAASELAGLGSRLGNLLDRPT